MSVPALQDPIRMLVYEWVIESTKDRKGKLLDIGCRDSGFPSYMSSIGFDVTGCERDTSFEKSQKNWQEKYGTFNFLPIDLRDINDKFDFITSIFALQHNAHDDMDINCYRKCASLLNSGGRIFISHEYNKDKGWIQEGRDDGDLRGYSGSDLINRLIHPIEEILLDRKIVSSWDIKYMRWDGLDAKWCDEQEAMTVCVEIKSL